MDQARNQEIDLMLVLKSLIQGKWKIISFIFIFLIVSISYISYTPNLYKVTTNIKQSNESLYFKYKYLNNILMKETEIDTKLFETSYINKLMKFNGFIINSSRIFQMFVNEFNDYEEMITVLSENNYIKDKMKNLNEKEKRKLLIKFAKKFIIFQPNNKYNIWKISFDWHEINQGTLLFNKALDLTLYNVQKSLLMEINNIANSIDLENQRIVTSLNVKLKSIRALTKLNNAKKIKFLIEQSLIAKELSIENNQLSNYTNMNNVSGLSQDRNDFFSTLNLNIPYYLRGFKSIDKEIELIQRRTNLDNDLMTPGYLEIKEKLLYIQSDNRSKILREAKNTINNDNITKWVNFDLELSEIQNLKRSNLIIVISIIIGAISGIFYVLISNSLNQIKNN